MKKLYICLGFVLSVFILCFMTKVEASEVKGFYFSAEDGKLVWKPVKEGENFFLNIKNMVPGGEYSETMTIENKSKKTFDLFLKAIPKQNSEKQKRLLELMEMKVYNNNSLIYDGNLSGKKYDNSISDLTSSLSLGRFDFGKQTEVIFNLKLNEATGIVYSDLMTGIDWEIKATEIVDDKPIVVPVVTPKTGVGSDLYSMLFLCGISLGLVLVLYIAIKIKKRKEVTPKSEEE